MSETSEEKLQRLIAELEQLKADAVTPPASTRTKSAGLAAAQTMNSTPTGK